MADAMAAAHLRPWWWVSVVGLVLLLGWDLSGLDLPSMRAFGDAQGFALREHWWLETVLHEGGRKAATAAYVVLLLLAISPWPPRWAVSWPRIEIAVAVTLGLLVVNAIKRNSLSSCPWDLEAFGGVASYVTHWRWGVGDGGPGNCFPGGHASAAFAFIGATVPSLASHDAAARRRGLWGLAVVMVLGVVFGLAQTLRGAHYPSHTAWTLAICWWAAWINHAVFAGLRRGRSLWHQRKALETGSRAASS